MFPPIPKANHWAFSFFPFFFFYQKHRRQHPNCVSELEFNQSQPINKT